MLVFFTSVIFTRFLTSLQDEASNLEWLQFEECSKDIVDSDNGLIGILIK